jgi:hypothetical protein
LHFLYGQGRWPFLHVLFRHLNFFLWKVPFTLLRSLAHFFIWSLIYLFFMVLGIEQKASNLSHSTIPFLMMGLFQERVSRTICHWWLGTTLLLISASWLAKITGMSHWHPVGIHFLGSLVFWALYIFWLPIPCQIYSWQRLSPILMGGWGSSI